MNMASSIASSFINAGFGTEKLLSNRDNNWMERNKDEGLMSLVAGLGLVNLWDIDCGPNELEKYVNSNETNSFKRAGYLLGMGIISSGVRDENEVALGVLREQLVDKKYEFIFKNSVHIKIAAILGLGLAYAGSQNEEVMADLTSVLEDFSFSFEMSAFASLALGLIYLGSGNDNVFGNMIGILLARNEEKNDLIEGPFLVLYSLGMGLLCFGMQKEADMMLEMTQIDEFSAAMKLYLKTFITSCAYAGSGNVLKVQEMMLLVAKQKDEIHAKCQVIFYL